MSTSKEIEEMVSIVNEANKNRLSLKIEITRLQWEVFLKEGLEFFGFAKPQNGMLALIRERNWPWGSKYFIELVHNNKTE
jgi:hypothetical protein